MQIFSTRKAKNKFESLLDKGRREPVQIENLGKPVVYVISPEEYERLLKLEDAYWAVKADQAEKSGYLSAKESEDFLDNLGK